MLAITASPQASLRRTGKDVLSFGHLRDSALLEPPDQKGKKISFGCAAGAALAAPIGRFPYGLCGQVLTDPCTCQRKAAGRHGRRFGVTHRGEGGGRGGLRPCFSESKVPFVSVSDASAPARLKAAVWGLLQEGQTPASPGQTRGGCAAPALGCAESAMPLTTCPPPRAVCAADGCQRRGVSASLRRPRRPRQIATAAGDVAESRAGRRGAVGLGSLRGDAAPMASWLGSPALCTQRNRGAKHAAAHPRSRISKELCWAWGQGPGDPTAREQLWGLPN